MVGIVAVGRAAGFAVGDFGRIGGFGGGFGGWFGWSKWFGLCGFWWIWVRLGYWRFGRIKNAGQRACATVWEGFKRAGEGPNSLEVLDGAAVEALGLGVVAHAQVEDVGGADAAAESFG